MSTSTKSKVVSNDSAIDFRTAGFRFHFHNVDKPEQQWATLQIKRSTYLKLRSELSPHKEQLTLRSLEILESCYGWYRLYVVGVGGFKQLNQLLRHLWKNHSPINKSHSRTSSRSLVEKMRPVTEGTISVNNVQRVAPALVVNNVQPIKPAGVQMCDLLKEIIEEERPKPASQQRIASLAHTLNQKFGHA